MKLDAHRVRGNGHDIHLGPIEFNVLRLMIEAPGKVFSRDELIGAAWPPNIHVGARTVDVHISRIRKALKTASPGSVIRTVRSAGYSLEKPDDWNQCWVWCHSPPSRGEPVLRPETP